METWDSTASSPATCIYCSLHVLRVNIWGHWNSCLKKLVTCPNDGCDSQLTRGDLRRHLEEECHATYKGSHNDQTLENQQKNPDGKGSLRKLITCPRRYCGKRLTQHELKHHLRRECLATFSARAADNKPKASCKLCFPGWYSDVSLLPKATSMVLTDPP